MHTHPARQAPLNRRGPFPTVASLCEQAIQWQRASVSPHPGSLAVPRRWHSSRDLLSNPFSFPYRSSAREYRPKRVLLCGLNRPILHPILQTPAATHHPFLAQASLLVPPRITTHPFPCVNPHLQWLPF